MTLSETLTISNTYPQYKTQAIAFCEAIEMSAKHPHIFVYVRLSTTTGLYHYDLVGHTYSDSKIIAVFKNAIKTL